MNKNYKAALDDAAKLWQNEGCTKGMALFENARTRWADTDFKVGADFAFNYQQAKIDKLVEALKLIKYYEEAYMNSSPPQEITLYIQMVDEALAQLEKDGE